MISLVSRELVAKYNGLERLIGNKELVKLKDRLKRLIRQLNYYGDMCRKEPDIYYFIQKKLEETLNYFYFEDRKTGARRCVFPDLEETCNNTFESLGESIRSARPKKVAVFGKIGKWLRISQ